MKKTADATQEVTLGNYTGLILSEAQKQLKALGLTAETVGTGQIITNQIPAPGTVVEGSSQVLLYLSGEDPG